MEHVDEHVAATLAAALSTARGITDRDECIAEYEAVLVALRDRRARRCEALPSDNGPRVRRL